MKLKTKKIFTVLLSFIMVVTMIPQSAFISDAVAVYVTAYPAHDIPNGSTIRLPFNTDRATLDKYQNKSYSYYDGSSTEPITIEGHDYVDSDGYMEFEMLDSEKTNTGSTTGVFAVSKESVVSGAFLASDKYDSGTGTRKDGQKANTYQGSDLQAAMTGIYNDMASFTQSAIMPTTKTDEAITTQSSTQNQQYGTSELKDDKVFAMSGEEADTFASDVKRRTPGANSGWWLRSPYRSSSNNAGMVRYKGHFSYYFDLSSVLGVRAALNLTASSLFVSSGCGVYTLIDSRNKVEFQDDNGKVIKTDMITTGDDATAPTDEEMKKTGYTFEGWDRTFTNVTSDMVVKPIYTPIKCDVTFTDGYNEEGQNIIDTQKVEYGKNAVAPNTPKRQGYVFDGWDKNFTQITGETTIEATWRTSSAYKVKYETGFDKELSDRTDVEWDQKNLLKNIKRDGFTFAGWYLDEEFKSDAVTNDMTYAELCGNVEKPTVTLYAKWLKNYNVKFYNIKGQETPIFDEYVPEGVFTKEVPEDNKGYVLANWYTLNAEGEDETFTIGKSAITGDTEVYGKWTPVECTVNFYSDKYAPETYATATTLKDWKIPEEQRPANPKDDTGNKAFECWEKEDGTEFNLNTETITENNLNLYGRWVDRKDINDVANITYNQNVEYTGKAITSKELGLKVTLKDGGKALTEGIDFAVTCDSVEAGNRKFTLKGKGYYKGSPVKTFTIKNPIVNNVTGLKVLSTTGTQINLKWTAAKQTTRPIAGYNVYDGSKKLVLRNIKTTNASLTKLAAGKAYTYIVKAYVTVGNKTIESKGVPVTGITIPVKVTLSKVTTKSKAVTAIWKKAICTKYEVQLATDKKFKKGLKKATAKASATTATIKSLKKGTTYYVRVRAVTTSGTTIKNGAWSDVKSIKCK